LIVICENILKITIIWQNELFNGKELKANIFVDLFHSNAGKIPHDNHSSLDSYSSNTNLPDS
jgi:hypothetical protein